MRIIYKNIDNSVGVLIPTSQALEFATITQIAVKDVPEGLSYIIVDDDTDYIPSDRTYRSAWEWDDTWTADGVGGESNEFDSDVLAGA